MPKERSNRKRDFTNNIIDICNTYSHFADILYIYIYIYIYIAQFCDSLGIQGLSKFLDEKLRLQCNITTPVSNNIPRHTVVRKQRKGGF